jgi:hypothetical protein
MQLVATLQPHNAGPTQQSYGERIDIERGEDPQGAADIELFERNVPGWSSSFSRRVVIRNPEIRKKTRTP